MTGADERAAAAERSVSERFAGRLLGMPATHLARSVAPARWRPGQAWNYWWQAHYLDALVDAGLRHLRTGEVNEARIRAHRADRLLATIRLRNLGRLPNAYYDDMAWLALATGRLSGLDAALGRPVPTHRLRSAERTLTAQLRSAVTEDLGGGVFWNRRRDFKNVPATGPVALHLARLGDADTARRLVDWMYARLWEPATGLFLDGVRLERSGERVVRDVYSYNQGTVLGTLVTLADPTSLERAAALVAAVDAGLTTDLAGRHVLRTHGGGDGGLFTGILARYLALATASAAPGGAGGLVGDDAHTARQLVEDTATAFWDNRSDAEPPVFPSDPARPAGDGGVVELSTQLQAWMTLEAAARVVDGVER